MLRVDLADFLRGRGHDVVRASETGHERADDAAILEKAVQQNRILITIDKHFGDWVVLPLSQALRRNSSRSCPDIDRERG